jgi:hypothetical protein
MPAVYSKGRRISQALMFAGLLGCCLSAQAQLDNPLAPSEPTPPPAPVRGGLGGPRGSPRGGLGAPQAPVPRAAPTAPDATTPPAEPPTPGDPLPADQLKALVLIEGDYSDGSGFVAKMHDQYFIVTNQHVLSGNTKFTITGMDGTKYPTTGALYGAMDYDVAILKIPTELAKYYLEIQDDAQAGTKPDDAVTVPGNSEGNGIAVQINGKLIGVGPELVEVDAKFVHGNSGSPIIHRPSGKVIGIATMVKKIQADDLSKAANLQELHWFGYRLDNIKSNRWSALDWARFSAEGIKVRELDDLIEVMVALLDGQKLPDVNNKEVDDAIIDYVSAKKSAVGRNSESAYIEALQNFLGRLQALVDNNVQSLASSRLYPYHMQKIKEDQEICAELDKAFAEAAKVGGHIMGNLN